MEKEKTPERRGEARAEVELDIDLATYGKYFLSKLVNVSVGGAFVKSKNLYPIGTQLKLRFKLPGEVNPIEATAQVAWTYNQPGNKRPNSSGMGVQFTNIQEEDRKKIADFVAISSD